VKMSVQKTYSITIEYSKDDGETLSESNHEYKELRKIILKRLNFITPISQGVTSAHIIGKVRES